MNKIIIPVVIIAAIAIVAASITLNMSMDSEMMQDSDMMDSEMTDTMTTSSLSGAVKIGIMLPLTGDLSSHGEENLMGAMFGIKTFNKYIKDAGEDWYLEAVTEDCCNKSCSSCYLFQSRQTVMMASES